MQRQKLNQEFDDSSDSDEEQPQIVVTKTGDLSAEQVEAEKRRIEIGEILFDLLPFRCYNYKTKLVISCCGLKNKMMPSHYRPHSFLK